MGINCADSKVLFWQDPVLANTKTGIADEDSDLPIYIHTHTPLDTVRSLFGVAAAAGAGKARIGLLVQSHAYWLRSRFHHVQSNYQLANFIYMNLGNYKIHFAL